MRPKRVTGVDLFDLFAYEEDAADGEVIRKNGRKRNISDYDEVDHKDSDRKGSDYDVDTDPAGDLSPEGEDQHPSKRMRKGDLQSKAAEDPVLVDEVEQSVELTFKMRQNPILPPPEDDGTALEYRKKTEGEAGSTVAKEQVLSKQQIIATTGGEQSAVDGAALHDTTAASSDRVLITHQIRHKVALPPKWDYVPISEHVPDPNPAHTFPFKLDPFQQTSMYSIERNESVLVSAHTSAGKTAIAEYAIALSLRNKQRVIYTSPIKALSNQKYREFVQTFGDVGLMTGDVTINPGAGCVVMTTEILRSMLYRGSYIEREVAWIIFDEIHYMRDAYRGVVWEETIIMLPDTVRYVFLSATVPNAMQFAEWICKIRKQPCHVVYTDFRPTPLQHYIFPSGGDGIYLAVDEKGLFLEDNFQKATSMLETGGAPKYGHKDRSHNNGDAHNNSSLSSLLKIIKLIMRRNYYPVIVFSFSKRECEFNAKQLYKFDLNTDEQKEMVSYVFKNAISSLGEDEKQLPQIVGILPLLQRGIGIHHSGLLPLVKEAIEILFQEGLIKVLFATETFSIGLNMPAKTVVFTSLRKWDGKESRWITSGEYIQMSGRAGRRGLDDRGIVILMLDEKMEPHIARGILKGNPDPFNSAFYLSYTMILNLMRLDLISPEKMLERSFFQFQACLKLPKVQEDLEAHKAKLNAIVIPQEDLVIDYHGIKSRIDEYEELLHGILTSPSNCLRFIQPGRFAQIKLRDPTSDRIIDYGWGVILSFQKIAPKSKDKYLEGSLPPKYVLFACVRASPGCDIVKVDVNSQYYKLPEPCTDSSVSGEAVIIAATFDCIYNLSPVMTKLKHDLKSPEGRRSFANTMLDVLGKFPNGLGTLDPIKDIGINDEKFLKFQSRLNVLRKRFRDHELDKCENKQELLDKYATKLKLGEEIKSISKEVKHALSAVQLHELKHRRRMLRRLGYITSANLIGMKGRVACEITACDELVLTEMIFDGIFNDLTIDQAVALLSCLTFQERSNDTLNLPEELEVTFRSLREHAKRIARISQECKIPITEDEYVENFRPELMEVAYAWSKGASFSKICKIRTDIFEGSIIRAIRRLEELLRQLITAAKSIGNANLENKFSDGEFGRRRIHPTYASC